MSSPPIDLLLQIQWFHTRLDFAGYPIDRDEKGIIPTQAHTGDGGWDLYARGEMIVDPGCTVKISTGIGAVFPSTWVGLVKDRSSRASDLQDTHGGVIDSTYQGDIAVIYENKLQKPVSIKRGERVAQVLFLYRGCQLSWVIQEPEIKTERGTKGFGSSGT